MDHPGWVLHGGLGTRAKVPGSQATPDLSATFHSFTSFIALSKKYLLFGELGIKPLAGERRP